MPTKRKPARPKSGTASAARRRITASQANIKRALKDLGINRPYYTARVVGGRIELRLYGGDVVYWPPEES